jgi:hypothetical protein
MKRGDARWRKQALRGVKRAHERPLRGSQRSLLNADCALPSAQRAQPLRSPAPLWLLLRVLLRREG